MARQYILKDVPCQKRLEQSFRKAHKVIERVQQRHSNSGKNKSLLHLVCKLSIICNRGPITCINTGLRYVNPHTASDRIILEQLNPLKYIPYKNNSYKDIDGNIICLPGYKD